MVVLLWATNQRAGVADFLEVVLRQILVGFWLVLMACNGGEIDDDALCTEGVDCIEDCTDETDNDGDGAVDCADTDCDGKCWEICDDGRDNDGDGDIDCEDENCLGECPEKCFDGEDNDGDGLIDCQDIDCTDSCPEGCEDEKDNDGDGLVDCEDPECDGDCPEVCDDERDNDGDELTDCEDIDCTDVCAEDCTDTVDNDGDGLVDCDDVECTDVCSEDCTDSTDNDGDGLVDCEDPECDGGCPEVCGDGRDNDGDGLTDCEDGECVESDFCQEDCTDTVDNDLDGLVDCEDDDCWGKVCHPEGTEAKVKSGSMTLQERYSFLYRFCSSSASSGFMFRNSSFEGGTAFNVKGQVKAKPEGATTWVTCDWSADTVYFGYLDSSSYTGSGSVSTRTTMAVVRNNFAVDSKCALGDSWFLPQYLTKSGSDAAITGTGTRWYQGTVTSSTSTYGSGSTSSGCSSFYSSNSSVYQVALEEGEKYESK